MASTRRPRGTRRIPVFDLVCATLVLVVAVVEGSFLIDFGVHLVYLVNLAIHLALVPATALRRTRVVGSFLASYGLLAALGVLVQVSPVNLGVSPVLLCAPLALLAITRHGPGPRWGWAALLLGVAGSFLSPVRGWTGGASMMALGVHILVLVGCYLWAAQQRSVADRHAAELASQEHEHRQAEARAVQAERLQVAREVHDVVAHSLAVVQVQAATALSIGTPELMRESLTNIKEVSVEALHETRSLVGVLRRPESADATGAAETAPLTGDLLSIHALVSRAAEAGVRLAAELPDDRQLEGWQQRLTVRSRQSVLRVIQEALTNVIKHAGTGSRARLLVAERDGAVEVQVDSAAPAAPTTPGFGLVGLRERVAMEGGEFSAGEQEAGFRVWARIPMTPAHPEVEEIDE